MLDAILERNSPFIYKIGTPLFYFYHIIIGNTFLNTAAEDATGFERLANQALAPWQYLCEGKKAIPHVGERGELTYTLERRFNYDKHFYIKTASSASLTPFSLTLGSALKGLAYLLPKTRLRADKICAAQHSRKVELNDPYYSAIGFARWATGEKPT